MVLLRRRFERPAEQSDGRDECTDHYQHRVEDDAISHDRHAERTDEREIRRRRHVDRVSLVVSFSVITVGTARKHARRRSLGRLDVFPVPELVTVLDEWY